MTAEIIQFVPRPNPNRPTLLEDVEQKVAEFVEQAPSIAVPHGGTRPIIDGMVFTAPDSDPA
jgi:hypothetical protein